MKDNINKDSIFEKGQVHSKSDLLPLLQKIQNKFGYIDMNYITELSKLLNMPAGKIYGIASFYSQFRFKPLSKYHIKLCTGASCHINSNSNLKHEVVDVINSLNEKEKGKEKFSIEFIPCMGACAKGPIICINDTYYHNINIRNLKSLLIENCK